jgi:hypothetical protein
MSKKVKREDIIVDSKAIFSLSYDFRDRTLLVHFQKKGLYSYSDVPDEVYYHMKFSDSVGRSFRKLILNNYKFTRLS